MKKNKGGRPRLDGASYSWGGFRLGKKLSERFEAALQRFRDGGSPEYGKSAFVRLLLDEAISAREKK